MSGTCVCPEGGSCLGLECPYCGGDDSCPAETEPQLGVGDPEDVPSALAASAAPRVFRNLPPAGRRY